MIRRVELFLSDYPSSEVQAEQKCENQLMSKTGDVVF